MGALCGACHHACIVMSCTHQKPGRQKYERAPRAMWMHWSWAAVWAAVWPAAPPAAAPAAPPAAAAAADAHSAAGASASAAPPHATRTGADRGGRAAPVLCVPCAVIPNPAWHAGLDPHLLLLLRGLRGGRLRRCGRLLLRRRQRHARRARRACAEGAVRVSFAPLLALRAPAAATPCATCPRGPSTQRGCRGERRKEGLPRVSGPHQARRAWRPLRAGWRRGSPGS